jgi:hypothetical protein
LLGEGATGRDRLQECGFPQVQGVLDRPLGQPADCVGAPAGRVGRVMPQACRALRTCGSAKPPPGPPDGKPEGRPLGKPDGRAPGVPLGAPEGRPVGRAEARPAALRHFWTFFCVVGSPPKPPAGLPDEPAWGLVVVPADELPQPVKVAAPIPTTATRTAVRLVMRVNKTGAPWGLGFSGL